MRYRVSVRRVQSAERIVRAADESEAAARIQAELDRPYGFAGNWRTLDTVLEVSPLDSALPAGSLPGSAPGGKLLLSVLEAAELLGVSRSMAYHLLRTGELGHVKVGGRTLISREQISDFITGHSQPHR